MRDPESDDGRREGVQDLEGALGEGAGKWRLVVTSDRPIEVMSLLARPGHLTNLSTTPGRMNPRRCSECVRRPAWLSYPGHHPPS